MEILRLSEGAWGCGAKFAVRSRRAGQKVLPFRAPRDTFLPKDLHKCPLMIDNRHKELGG